MSDDPVRNQLDLQRYHDGELGVFERLRFERRLRRSPQLQRELEALRELSRQIAAGLDGAYEPSQSPDLWRSVARALPAIDAQVEAERAGARTGAPRRVRRRRLPLPGWALVAGALAAGALAAAAALALLLVRGSALPLLPGGDPGRGAPASGNGPVASVGGVIRYLDSGEAAVMVIEDEGQDITIVWSMDSV